MKMLKPLVAATALTVATSAIAVPQVLSNTRNVSAFLDTYGNVYLAGNCRSYAMCGPLSGKDYVDATSYKYTRATYAEFQNGKYVYTGTHGVAVIDKNGGIYQVGNITLQSDAMDWTQIDVPGTAVDAAWDNYLNLWILVDTAAGTELYKFSQRDRSVVKVGDRTNWLMIDASDSVVALDVYGNVYAWGRDTSMYGNNGSATDVPPAEPTVQGKRFKKVTAGNKLVVGLTTENVPYAWGSNSASYGPLTTASNEPATIPGMETATDAVAGANAAVFVDTEGKLVVGGWHNLRSYSGQSMRTVTGTSLVIPYQDTGLTMPYTPNSIPNGIGSANFFIEDGVLMGWSSNQWGELALGSDTPEYHYITRTVPFVGTPPMLSLETLEEAATDGRDLSEVVESKRSERCNASANNGRGGNYARTGMCDNGKGKARDNVKRASNKVFTDRGDGRGFKRSNS